MNLSANLLGLDNAATPMGLKAMQQLQELNPNKESASNSMVMFLCINASGLTLIPITIMMYRAQLGAANPSDVFLPIMLATFTSTLVAILAVCVRQKINILQRNLILFSGDWGYLSEAWYGYSTRWNRSKFPCIRLIRQHASFYHYLRIIISGMRKRSMYMMLL